MKLYRTIIIIFTICIAINVRAQQTDKGKFIPMFESGESLTSIFNNAFQNKKRHKENPMWFVEFYNNPTTELGRSLLIREYGLPDDIRINKRIQLINLYDYDDEEVFYGLDLMFNTTRSELDQQFGAHRHSVSAVGEYKIGNEYWLVDENRFIYLMTLELRNGLSPVEEENGSYVDFNLYQMY